METKKLLGLTPDQLRAVAVECGMAPFAGKQMAKWIYQKRVTDIDLPKAGRARLRDEGYTVGREEPLAAVRSTDGTAKYLFRGVGGRDVEAVCIPDKDRTTICVSSQAGCRMGCVFCASTIGGLKRNLSASEMLGQIYQIQKIIGERVSNVVIMGTGEPLDNYNNFLKFIHILTDEHGLNISQRNVTVSTCGIVPKILELAEERLQITLALSLHGSTQEKRRKLMPVANKYELGEVLSACDTYFKKTGRRVTFEYSLVHEVNDTDEDAKELSELLAPRNCHLNLIPVNPVKERSFQRPSRKSALNFKNKLEKSGINVTIRREMGSDIDGACGQLRRRYEEETMNEN